MAFLPVKDTDDGTLDHLKTEQDEDHLSDDEFINVRKINESNLAQYSKNRLLLDCIEFLVVQNKHETGK